MEAHEGLRSSNANILWTGFLSISHDLKMSFKLYGAALISLFAIVPSIEAQQTFEPIQLGPVTFFGSIRDRVENWHWFTPAAGDHNYTFDGNTIRLGFSENLKPLDWMVEFEAPMLFDLPTNAVAAGNQGQLGLGASYYVANDKQSNVAMVFPKQVFVRFHSLFGSESNKLQIGRFEFFDGAEVKSTDPTVAAVKRERIQQRLIGTFAYTDVLRAFDGFHYSYDTPSVNYTLVGAVPTRGSFRWMAGDGIASYSVTGLQPASFIQPQPTVKSVCSPFTTTTIGGSP